MMLWFDACIRLQLPLFSLLAFFSFNLSFSSSFPFLLFIISFLPNVWNKLVQQQTVEKKHHSFVRFVRIHIHTFYYLNGVKFWKMQIKLDKTPKVRHSSIFIFFNGLILITTCFYDVILANNLFNVCDYLFSIIITLRS